jgi:Uncharacterised nucleotidyltransferase
VTEKLIVDRPAEAHGTPRRSAPSESLRILCLCLGALHAPAAPETLRRAVEQGVDWVGLATLANAHLVGPALWIAFERHAMLPDLPGDFRDYLGAIHRANAIRLETMRSQAGRAFAALNAGGIAPLVLKGGARLVEAMPEAGHMMADLDLLVEQQRFDAALAALGRLGYRRAEEDGDQPRHAVTLRHPDELAAIDLHRDIGPQRDFIPLAEAVRSAAPMTVEGCRLRLLSPTHRVMHVFFHSQIHDRGQIGGVVPLRPLEHFAWLVARHGQAVDWTGIARACSSLRLRAAWEAWLYLADRCLATGAAVPMRPTRGARLHYRRCLLQADLPRVNAVLRAAGAVTGPFSYATITYKYRCGGSRLGLYRARLAEGLRLIRKYGHRLPQRLAAAIRDAQERRV